MNYLLAFIDKLDEASFFCRQTRNDPDGQKKYWEHLNPIDLLPRRVAARLPTSDRAFGAQLP